MNRRGSATDALGLAIGHVKTVLLQPFDMARWVMLGCIAFLAYLGEGGFGYTYRKGWGQDDAFTESMRSAVSWMLEHRVETAIILFLGFFIILVVGVLFKWLSSRSTFVYIDCLATNRAELVRPWKEHRDIAESYFFWRLAFALCGGFVNLLLALPLIISFFSLVASGDEINPGRILFGTGLVLLTLPLLFIVIVIEALMVVTLRDFVAPVQYLRGIKCGQAFRIVLGLMKSSTGSFIVYFLLKIVIAIVTFLGVFLIGCATCCVGFCCLALPVIGQTILQPLYVFNRSFSLFFLQGFGPDLDVFGPGAPGGGLPGPPPPPPAPAPTWASTPWPSAPAPPPGEPPAPVPETPLAAPAPAAPSAPPESVPLSAWPEPPYDRPAPESPATVEPPAEHPAEPPAEPPPSDPGPDPEKDSGPS